MDGCALKRHTEDTVLNHLVLSNANKDFLSSDKLGDVILLCSLWGLVPIDTQPIMRWKIQLLRQLPGVEPSEIQINLKVHKIVLLSKHSGSPGPAITQSNPNFWADPIISPLDPPISWMGSITILQLQNLGWPMKSKVLLLKMPLYWDVLVPCAGDIRAGSFWVEVSASGPGGSKAPGRCIWTGQAR